MAVTQMYRVQQIVTGVPGAPLYMTGYFDGTGGTPQQAATAWSTFCKARLTGNYQPIRYEAISTVDFVDPVTGNIVGLLPVTTAVYNGGTAGEPLPFQTQLVVNWRTGQYVAGREVRGRTNCPSYTEADNSAGVPLAGTITALTTAANALIADTTSTFVVYSRKAGEHYEVVSPSIPQRWSVLRTRRG